MTDEWSEEQWGASDAAIRAAAHAILAEGPLAIDELAARLARDGVLAAFDGCESDELEEIVDEALVETDETWHSNSGVICLVSELLRGAILTHRVTADELERGVLDAMPDLAAIGWGLGHGWTLPSGGEIVHADRGKGEQRLADDGSFVGPAGWLDGIDSGELVAATCDGERFDVGSVAPRRKRLSQAD